MVRVLSLNAGRVKANGALLRQVWNRCKAGDVDLVRNFVKKLRADLRDDAAAPAWIYSERSSIVEVVAENGKRNYMGCNSTTVVCRGEISEERPSVPTTSKSVRGRMTLSGDPLLDVLVNEAQVLEVPEGGIEPGLQMIRDFRHS